MLRKEFSERVNVRTTVLEQLLKFTDDEDWRTAFRTFRAQHSDGECVVRLQVGDNVFISDRMSVGEVSYSKLKNIIRPFRFGDLHTYEEYIHITYIIFQFR